MRAAIAAVSDLVALPAPLLAHYQAEESLDPDVQFGPEPVAVDWALINAWRDAVGRLRDDASTALPEVRR